MNKFMSDMEVAEQIAMCTAKLAAQGVTSNKEFTIDDVMQSLLGNSQLINTLVSDPEKYSGLITSTILTLVKMQALDMRTTKKGNRKFSVHSRLANEVRREKMAEANAKATPTCESKKNTKIFAVKNQEELDEVLKMAANNPNLKLSQAFMVDTKTGKSTEITGDIQKGIDSTISSKTKSAPQSASSTSSISRISRTQIVKNLQDNPGKFFSVTYTKADGTDGSTSGILKKEQMMNEQGYLIVHTKEGIRNVNPRTITGARVGGSVYLTRK